MTTSFASLLRSLEYGKAAANLGNEVTLCYLHPSFHPPATYYDLMESYQSSNFTVVYPFPKPKSSSKTVIRQLSKAKVIGKVVDGKPTLKGLFRQILVSLRYVPQEIKWVKRPKPDVIMARPLDTWRARRAGAVLYISQPCWDLWRKKNIPTEKLFYTPNAAHPEKWKPLEPKRRDSMRASFGLTGARVIGFSGNLRSWHGVNLLAFNARQVRVAP